MKETDTKKYEEILKPILVQNTLYTIKITQYILERKEVDFGLRAINDNLHIAQNNWQKFPEEYLFAQNKTRNIRVTCKSQGQLLSSPEEYSIETNAEDFTVRHGIGFVFEFQGLKLDKASQTTNVACQITTGVGVLSLLPLVFFSALLLLQ